jgi:hypothetical protein
VLASHPVETRFLVGVYQQADSRPQLCQHDGDAVRLLAFGSVGHHEDHPLCRGFPG